MEGNDEMVPDINRILFATDLSDTSKFAFNYMLIELIELTKWLQKKTFE